MVVDVGDEAGGGVEVCVGLFVGAEEVGRGVGEGGVAGGVALRGVCWRGGGWGSSGIRGRHCGEEDGEGEGEKGAWAEGTVEEHLYLR